MMRSRSLASMVATGALLAALVGCSAPAGEGTPASPGSSPSGSITVFAAASLKGTFTELASAFEEQHPGTTVELSFAGSSDLVTQITNGAPADVFASADEKNMAKLTDAGLIEGTPTDFATNTLEIAVPPGDPAGVASFADLGKAGVTTVVCAAQVPCGAATATLEKATGVDIRPVSEESSVTDVLGKVTSGEADAGLVYVTDVTAAGDAVTGIPFPESAGAVNTYPIAPVKAAPDPDLAAAFTAYVTGAAGRRVLAAAGFGTP
ncbi:molybdate ABC transporter substrate-binding protein [Clavibacter sp. VKM Ac-2872]|uniref:molybdate ABC transporter substrate-binding protein n=1 Tax=Clavibacter sp. VKM Ac-2872 TaxID=2783812 RepID=UPI00188B1CD8|nr:molybdate ABC transporter substrate-binding protein [Clavibacter sp. VKM Ac-2872]MBF4625703.1 molybdate ABC transporter substrate-binding protein [Clavibacter sp. VKM Ac-2872]